MKEIAAQRIGLPFVAQVGAGSRELPLERLRNAINRDQNRFVGAEHRVVEGLAVHDAGGGGAQIGGVVDVDRGVPRPHSDRGIGGGVGGAHHRRTPGGEDHVRLLRAHELADERQAHLFEHLYRPLRCARSHRRLRQRMDRVDAGLVRRGVRAHHDSVAGEQGGEHLEVHGGHGVGGRHQREHHARRSRDLDEARVGIHPGVDEVPVPVIVHEGDAGELVLLHLVLDHPEAGLPAPPIRRSPSPSRARCGPPRPQSPEWSLGRSAERPGPPSPLAPA